ncbi:hypothetical protein QWA68_002720 [Fusarium oxysporum]|nr:hypothetical protein QWA68_002720 [Fusarium oxysporum]
MPRLRDMTAYRLPLVLFLPAPLICCMIALQGLSNRIHLDTIHVLSQSDLRFYELTCWSPHEDHASGVISQMADALLILLTVQLVPQAILIAQRRWARTAKALSLALTSATLAFLLAILVKTSLLVKDLEATGPFPQLEQYCSTPRAESRARFEFRNDTDESEVQGVVILCAFDCAYKIVLVMFLFVLPTPMRIPIPFEPIVTGSKAHCLSEDSLIPPETGPVSKAWKNARQLSLSRGDACTALISTGNNTNQPSWVLSKRLTRMPVVASKSPCFSAQIQHWTQDRYRYRGLHAVIIFLSLAILFDILLLFAHLVTPIANERPYFVNFRLPHCAGSRLHCLYLTFR